MSEAAWADRDHKDVVVDARRIRRVRPLPSGCGSATVFYIASRGGRTPNRSDSIRRTSLMQRRGCATSACLHGQQVRIVVRREPPTAPGGFRSLTSRPAAKIAGRIVKMDDGSHRRLMITPPGVRTVPPSQRLPSSASRGPYSAREREMAPVADGLLAPRRCLHPQPSPRFPSRLRQSQSSTPIPRRAKK
jgi:hypothetical protein